MEDPDQLTEDFLRARAERPIRTVFAVGDPKQSIFSFQGASPAPSSARAAFHDLSTASRRHRTDASCSRTRSSRFHFGRRTTSWGRWTRSSRSPPISGDCRSRSLVQPGHRRNHAHSARQGAPGLVESGNRRPRRSTRARRLGEAARRARRRLASVRLANRIATLIERWRTSGDEAGRRIRPGDVLILVRSRGAFFEAMIRALKDARCLSRARTALRSPAYRGARSGRARPGVACCRKTTSRSRRPEIAAGRPR